MRYCNIGMIPDPLDLLAITPIVLLQQLLKRFFYHFNLAVSCNGYKWDEYMYIIVKTNGYIYYNIIIKTILNNLFLFIATIQLKTR